MLTEEMATCWLAALLDLGMEPGPKLAGRCLECCPEHAPRHQIACWPQHPPAAVLVVLAACHRLPHIHTHDYQVDLAHFSFFFNSRMLRTGTSMDRTKYMMWRNCCLAKSVAIMLFS